MGKDHPDVAQSLNNLAALYYAQGKFDKAEPMYRRALEILDKSSFGKNDSNITAALENLAALLRKTNRKAEAQEMEERARVIRGGRKGD